MRRAWIAIIGSWLALTAVGCRKQGQAPPVANPVAGRLYTWPASERVVPTGTLVVIRTFQTVDTAASENQKIFPALIARDIPNSSGKPVVFGGSPATVIVLSNPAGGYRLGLHSVVIGGSTYLTAPAGQGIEVQVGGGVERGAALGSLIDIVPMAGGVGQGNSPVSVEGPRIFVPNETLLFFRLRQPLQFE